LLEVEKEIKIIENDKLQVQEQYNNLCNSNNLLKNFKFDSYRIENIAKTINFLTTKIEENKEKILLIENELEHLNVQSKLEQYTKSINAGEPCPLCGSLEHPKILDIQNVSISLKNSRNCKNKIEKENTEIENSINSLNNISQKLLFKQEELNKNFTKKTDAFAKIEHHKTLFKWEVSDTFEVIENKFKLAEKLKVEIEIIEKTIEKNSKEIEKETKNKEKYKETLDKLNQELTNNKSVIELLKSQIEILKVNDFLNSDIEQLKNEINNKQNFIKKTIENFNLLNKQIAESQNICNNLTGKIGANKTILVNEKEKSEQINNKINEQLKNSSYNIEEIKNILLQEIDIDKEKLNVNNFKQAVLEIENQLKPITIEINNRVYVAESHNLLKAEILNLINNIKQLNQDFGKIKNEINKLNDDLLKIKILQKEGKSLSERAEDIKILKNLFKGSGFVNFVSTVYLQNLCNNANERFYKLTKQKLSLEITEENSFQVRDFMNDGKTRNIKTLSGGQTFQAALSLALALADNVQKIISSNHNFFFLDEGFGTLDKDSLNIVFDTLKLLQKENRIVGVISHVEDMKEEIESNLQIINNEELGSLIKPSWE